MKRVVVVAGIGLVLCSPVAIADPDPAKVPLQNAAGHVTANGVKNPQAPGLQNARDRIVDNAARQEENRNEHNHPNNADGKNAGGRDAGAGPDRAQGVERTERTERVERVERVERAERPERPERVERPDRPSPGQDRVVRVDRPVPPGQARK
jgi:hypothetical protein